MGTGEITFFRSRILFFVLPPGRADTRCFVGKQPGMKRSGFGINTVCDEARVTSSNSGGGGNSPFFMR